jgi:5-(carboxyamino)imidazole ribonucleotide mutase
MKALVGIIMGSDSDLPVMSEAAKVLEELGIGAEMHVLSAHRTPAEVVAYAKKAEAGGVKVFICGAGLAAALPGVVAGHVAVPVVGVPLTSKASASGGLDAILSIVQMPPGIPVAAVAVNGAKNAGILAAQIIGVGDVAVGKKVAAYKEKMRSGILAKDAELQKKGHKKYLKDNGL